MIYSFILNTIAQVLNSAASQIPGSESSITGTLNPVADTLAKAGSQTGSSLESLSFDMNKIRVEDWVLMVLGVAIVFAALLVISYTFILVIKAISIKLPKKGAPATEPPVSKSLVTGDVNAAIAAALYLHFQEIHDMENTVLTIERVRKNYSPWSSKIYGIRQIPFKINKNWIIK